MKQPWAVKGWLFHSQEKDDCLGVVPFFAYPPHLNINLKSQNRADIWYQVVRAMNELRPRYSLQVLLFFSCSILKLSASKAKTDPKQLSTLQFPYQYCLP